MDLRNVKDLQKKMHICDRVHSAGLITCVIAYATGALFMQSNQVTGIILLATAVLLALISGTAQVMGSYLYAEDLYRITGRRPRKKKGTRK